MMATGRRRPPKAGAGQLGTSLRASRKALGMTIEALSTRSGCSQAMLSKVETGKSLPSIPTLTRIADALGVTMGSLLDPQPPEPPPGGRIVIDMPVDGTGARLHGDVVAIAPGVDTDIDADPAMSGVDAVGFVIGGSVTVGDGAGARSLGAGGAFAIAAGRAPSLRSTAGGSRILRMSLVPPVR